METNSFMSHSVSQRTMEWIKQYASRIGVKTLVVGISGGIDSAVVSTLCCMTGIDTILVSMPIKQNPTHLKRAYDHIQNLKSRFSNAKTVQYDLTAHFTLFENCLKSTTVGKPDERKELINVDLTLANTRSRLRMIMLYQVAGTTGGLVVGTGNKVEDFGVGFFTKYGDGGVDISPIGDFTKTEVRILAKELEVIQSIQDAKPSDGLWDSDDKDDEDQLGATYEELESAMAYLEINPFFDAEDLEVLSDRQKEVLNIYISRHRANLHKMNPIPVFRLPRHLKYSDEN